MTRFAWVVIVILLIVFIVAAIKVFNPVLHPDLVVTSGEGGTSLVQQIRYAAGGSAFGTILLIVIAGLVSWVLSKG